MMPIGLTKAISLTKARILHKRMTSQGEGLIRTPEGYYRFFSGVRGLKEWVFHQYDPDFHPSVPHGHFQRRNQPKLDPYLGWVYRGSKQIDRKPRQAIIDLWNFSCTGVIGPPCRDHKLQRTRQGRPNFK